MAKFASMKRVLRWLCRRVPAVVAVMVAVVATARGADTASRLAAMGLVDVKTVAPEVVVDLMYARADNFTGVVLYGDLRRAFLHPLAARAVARAQAELSRLHPGWRLKICDAARPMSAQRRMYAVVRGTRRARYVSNPARGGGLHNYGMAVDVTIVDAGGREIDMGTRVDHLGPEAGIGSEAAMVKRGVISAAARRNRQLLRQVMAAGGFKPLRSEWWHFNLCTRAQAKARYKLIP